jgi:hypothetical protein
MRRYASGAFHYRLFRQIEHERDPPRAASRTLQALVQVRYRKGRAAGPDERFEVEFRAPFALPDLFHSLPPAPGASDMDAPTELPRVAYGLDCHENGW